MTEKLPDHVVVDLICAMEDRLTDQLQLALQLVEDNKQRGEILIAAACFCAHEGAHYMHEAEKNLDLGTVWLKTIKAIGQAGACTEIRKVMQAKAAAKK